MGLRLLSFCALHPTEEVIQTNQPWCCVHDIIDPGPVMTSWWSLWYDIGCSNKGWLLFHVKKLILRSNTIKKLFLKFFFEIVPHRPHDSYMFLHLKTKWPQPSFVLSHVQDKTEVEFFLQGLRSLTARSSLPLSGLSRIWASPALHLWHYFHFLSLVQTLRRGPFVPHSSVGSGSTTTALFFASI